MKTKLFVLSLACLLLAGCVEKVNVSDADYTTDLSMGLALPVGSMTVTLGDFLGNGQVDGVYVTSEGGDEGLLYYCDTFKVNDKPFHRFNIEKYALNNPLSIKMKLRDKTSATSITGDGVTETKFVFDFDLGVEGINNDTTTERLDSMLIASAQFTSAFNIKNLDSLKWSELKKVDVILGDQFNRADGKRISLPISGAGYGQKIPIEVNNFYLNLMKDKTKTPSNKNVVNRVKFQVEYTLVIENGRTISITDESAIEYDLGVKLWDYDILWGYFEGGQDVRDEGVEVISNLWSGWKDLKRMKLRLVDPQITLTSTYKVAAPLMVQVDYIYVVDPKTGKKAYAQWGTNKATSHTYYLENTLDLNNPTVYNDTSLTVSNTASFSSHPENGAIDGLFDVHPDSLYYSFKVKVDRNKLDQYPQHRVTRDFVMRSNVEVKVPFRFKANSEVEYENIEKNVDISQFSLDSLIAKSEFIDSVATSDLRLILLAENGLPFAVKGHVDFLDKDSNIIEMPILENDTLSLPAPTDIQNELVITPAKKRIIVQVSKNELKKLAEVKSIRYNVSADGNVKQCRLTDKTKLRVQIGAAARLEGIMDLEKLFNKEK